MALVPCFRGTLPYAGCFSGTLRKDEYLLKREPQLVEIFSFIVTIVGEIGNNAFDHNLGTWRDEAGLYFYYDISSRLVVLADRGLGIRQH